LRSRRSAHAYKTFHLSTASFTLFMLTADRRGTDGVKDVIKARTGQVLVVDAPAPGIGWP
jgi:hypothetical protein